MKRKIEIFRAVAIVALVFISVAIIGLTVAGAVAVESPPELPTLTAPAHDWEPTPTRQWILTSTPGPYPPPPPIVNTPGPYPQPDPNEGGYSGFLPVQVDVESYP